MKFTGHFTGAKLDLEAYKRLMQTYLDDKLREGAKAWLAGTTGRVPVWSGMSRASLLELTGLVGGKIVISPRVASRIPEGEQLGTAVQKDFIITVTTAVPHYTLQEYTNVGVSGSAPWHSLKAGADAYRENVKDVRLPRPKIQPVKI